MFMSICKILYKEIDWINQDQFVLTLYRTRTNESLIYRMTPTPTPDCESRDLPGPLIDIIPIAGPGTRGLRRNSISLPAGLDTMDLAALRAAHRAEDEANDKVSLYIWNEWLSIHF